jgi:hypothetical protein
MKFSKYNCKNLLSSLIKDRFTLFLKKSELNAVCILD